MLFGVVPGSAAVQGRGGTGASQNDALPVTQWRIPRA